MKLAVLHYHLGHGGVTRVVANHLASLAAAKAPIERVLLLHGGDASGWVEPPLPFPVEHVVIPELAYDESNRDGWSLAATLRAKLSDSGAGCDETVVHTHNHSLGKNVAVAGALRELAAEGWPLLLQIHDFAEDFRAAGYARLVAAFGGGYGETLYPQFERTHYAVLNGRDRGVLADAGIDDERLHFLPNPVSPMPTCDTDDLHALRRQLRAQCQDRFGIAPDEEFWLYPVRGIRRKNLGESLLLAHLLEPHGVKVGVTLAPANPKELAYYDAWREFAAAERIPFAFGSGEPGELSFAENLLACDRTVTTSVAEGFGMVFLEGWPIDLGGRNLPEITSDFVSSGLNLSGLHDRVDVTLTADERDAHLDALAEAYSALAVGYGRDVISRREAEVAFERSLVDGRCDFGSLHEQQQMSVIRRLRGTVEGDRLVQTFHRPPLAADLRSQNADVVAREYSLAGSGHRLAAIYRQLLESGGGERPEIDAAVVLDRLLSLDRFRLIRA